MSNLPRPAIIFAGAFALLCLLYCMTVSAGWAYDSVVWIGIVRDNSFIEHLNLGHHNGLSHYQLTQFILWLMFRLFGTASLPYFLIHVGLQALNVTLLYRIVLQILHNLNAARAVQKATLVALLFCVSPYAGEVIVYKAAFHFALGLSLLLSVCWLLIVYINRPSASTAWSAGLLYAASLFSIELSYLTPCFGLVILLWYRRALGWDKARIRPAVIRILAPQWTMLLILLAANYFSRSEAGLSIFSRPVQFFAIKPPLFLLHLLWGRFLPESWRAAWLQAFCTYVGAGIFYLGLLLLIGFSILRVRRFSANGKLAALGLGILLPAAALAALMWFPEHGFIYCDRYLYALLPGEAIVMVAGIYAIRLPTMRGCVVGIAILLSVACTLFNNSLWWQATRIIKRLEDQASELRNNSEVLLLNSAWSYRGAPMTFPGPTSGFRARYIAMRQSARIAPITEVMSFNMHASGDGAHVRVLDDSTLIVILNQRGPWVRSYDPAVSYSTPSFSVRIIDSQRYELRLRNPDVQLWYQTGDRFRVVDMSIRDRDQK